MPPSVLIRTTTPSGPSPRAARRSGSASAARAPARVAAPLGPEETPSRLRSAPAVSAAASVTAPAASQPGRSPGQAAAETVPQLRPAMTVFAVETEIGSPAIRLASRPPAGAGATAHHPDRRADQVGGLFQLIVDLFQQGLVARHDPGRDLLVPGPGRVLNQGVTGTLGRHRRG